MPVVEPTLATEILLLSHVPPEVASLSVVVDPTHTAVVPVIDNGNAFTVTTVVARQPVDSV